MNERIKELAEQARKKPMGDSWTYRYFGEFEEKFAELIVKECHMALFPALSHKITRHEAYDLIKKHFGVEE